MRTLSLVIVLQWLTLSSAHAGLQSALAESLAGLSAAGERLTHSTLWPPLIIPIGQERPPRFSPLPDDLLFVDPITSTFGEAVYRGGPDFAYDAETGGLTISAPPMLGPTDEFGQRTLYAPEFVRVAGAEHFVENPTIPSIVRFRRNNPIVSLTNGEILPIGENSPSYIVDEDSSAFDNLRVGDQGIEVRDLNLFHEPSAAIVHFDTLLEPGLPADLFHVDDDHRRINGYLTYLPESIEGLSDIQIIVQYERVPSALVGLQDLRQINLVAIQAIPEPSVLALVVLPLMFACTGRRRYASTR